MLFNEALFVFFLNPAGILQFVAIFDLKVILISNRKLPPVQCRTNGPILEVNNLEMFVSLCEILLVF